MTVQLEAVAALRVFDRIVCGIDGSQGSLEAARQAQRLRDPLGTLHLTTVVEIDTAVHAGWATSHVLAQLEQGSRQALHQAIDEIDPTSGELVADAPVHALLKQIEAIDATLVAVGPHRRSRAVGILLGGVATTMLHEAPCSVLLARPPADPARFPARIGVGVDGSSQSLRALAVAESVARRFDADLVPLTATGGKSIFVDPLSDLSEEIAYSPAPPVEALVELSGEVDLLVVGSRGLHGLGALGSVSERVGHRAECSVLVVR